MIVEDKQGLGGESVFEFKYIPDLSKTTKMERGRDAPAQSRGNEKRSFWVLLLSVCSVCAVVWMAANMLVNLLRVVITAALGL